MAKLSILKFRKALEGSLGIISTIAKRCSVQRISIYRFLEKHPELKKELETEKDKILDRAESVLFEKVNEGDWRATEFILSKIGSKRGYAEKRIVDTTISGKMITHKDFEDAYEEIKDGPKDSDKEQGS